MKPSVRRFVRVCLVTSVLLAVVVCDARAPGTSRGAERDVRLDWKLALAWSVGGVSDTALVIATLRAHDIATHNGQLLVLDRDRAQVARYSATGGRLGPIGHRGGGPGEFLFPRSITADPTGRIIVEDPATARLSIFDANGRFVRTFPRASEGSIQQIRAVNESTLAGLILTRDSITLALQTEERLRRWRTIPAPERVGTAPVCSTTGYEFTQLFGPSILFATSGSMLVYAVDEYEITVVRDGRVAARHARPILRRPANRTLARQHLGKGIRIRVLGMPPCLVPTEMILAVAPIASRLPAYGALALEPTGGIWAMRYAIGKESAMADIFDPVNGYVGTVHLGQVRPVAFLDRSLVVSIENDAEEVPVVRVYRLTR